jgi:hypothetical protein
MMWVCWPAAGFAITLVREHKRALMRLQVAYITPPGVGRQGDGLFPAVLGVIVLMLVFGIWLGMRPRNPGWLALAALSINFALWGS